MTKAVAIPPELAAKCEEITKNWLASYHCEAVPYLQPCCELDDEWRIAVWHVPPDPQEKVLLCKYLQPTVEGYTLYLLARACFDSEARGKDIGKNEALLKLFKQQCETVGIDDNSSLTITLERKVMAVR